MYINRKDGTLVEAEIRTDNYGGNPYWCITHNGKQEFLNEPEFESQYGEAMICPNYKTCKTECTIRTPHIKNDFCFNVSDCITFCIPYIPEQKPKKDKLTESFEQMMIDTFNVKFVDVTPSQKQADEEPVFPVCGTCNARKDAYLLLPPEKIRDILQTGGTPFDFSMEIARAELDHLAKLGIVYVEIPKLCSYCDGVGYQKVYENDRFDVDKCHKCNGTGKDLIKVEYIPLSEYMEVKK